MNRRWADQMLVVLAVVFACGSNLMGQGNVPTQANRDGALVEQSTDKDAGKLDGAAKEPAAAAIEYASQAGKFIFLFFYRIDDEPTRAARTTFDSGMKALADRAMSTKINVTDVREEALVEKFQLSRSPMPLVLAMAPNGVVTRNFVGEFSQSDFETAFVGPGMQKALKVLQDRKMLFVSLQNDVTLHNAEAMQGVRDFVADPSIRRRQNPSRSIQGIRRKLIF